MDIRTVLVCAAQVPLSHGGAEILAGELVAQLQRRGYQADLVRLPFKWYPHEALFEHAAAWRLIDLSESGGQRIDRVIATKFPSYFVRHPNKVTWLTHQHRAAYELCGTKYGDFDYLELDVGLRERLFALDREMLLDYLSTTFSVRPSTAPAVAPAHGPGAAILEMRCQSCHDMHLIRQQRLDAAGWRREVDKMIGWGAVLDDAEREALIGYLAGRLP